MKKTIIYLPVVLLTLATVLSAAVLLDASVSADASISNIASVTVNSTCSFNTDYGHTSIINLMPGTTSNTESDENKPISNLTCNNPNGFEIDGVAYSPTASSGGVGVEGATSMYGANGTITTGTSGTDSFWAFKVTTLTASTSASTSYSDYSEVPSSTVPVATFTGSSTAVVTGTFRPDYEVYASPVQAAGIYDGGMKYTVVSN